MITKVTVQNVRVKSAFQFDHANTIVIARTRKIADANTDAVNATERKGAMNATDIPANNRTIIKKMNVEKGR